MSTTWHRIRATHHEPIYKYVDGKLKVWTTKPKQKSYNTGYKISYENFDHNWTNSTHLCTYRLKLEANNKTRRLYTDTVHTIGSHMESCRCLPSMFCRSYANYYLHGHYYYFILFFPGESEVIFFLCATYIYIRGRKVQPDITGQYFVTPTLISKINVTATLMVWPAFGRGL